METHSAEQMVAWLADTWAEKLDVQWAAQMAGPLAVSRVGSMAGKRADLKAAQLAQMLVESLAAWMVAWWAVLTERGSAETMAVAMAAC